MFIGVKELEQHELTFQEEFAPGTVDFHSAEFRQAGPLQVTVSATLEGEEIHIAGRLKTRLALPCARCLGPIERAVERRFELFYRPVASIRRDEEIELHDQDLDYGFYSGDGLFLADVVAEQVHLALPMKTVCSEECRGLCPHCGANLNRERCRCGSRPMDPRLAPLAEWLDRKKSQGAG